MTAIKRIQISKAIISKIINKEEAIFFMSLINVSESLSNAVDFLLIFTGSKDSVLDKTTLVPGYSIQEHMVISNYILDKITGIEVSESELVIEVAKINNGE